MCFIVWISEVKNGGHMREERQDICTPDLILVTVGPELMAKTDTSGTLC